MFLVHIFSVAFTCPSLTCIDFFSAAGYMNSSINDGPGCLMLRCPDPSCIAAVGQDMINALASKDDVEKYTRYFLRSFVEDNRKVIRCTKLFRKYDVKVACNSLDVIAKTYCWGIFIINTFSFCFSLDSTWIFHMIY